MSTRLRRVRSIVVRAVVFLLLGAVANVAVAWGYSFFASTDPGNSLQQSVMGFGDDGVSISRQDRSGATTIWFNRWPADLLKFGRAPELILPPWFTISDVAEHAALLSTNSPGEALSGCIVFACGVPLRTVRAEMEYSDWNEISRIEGVVTTSWPPIDPFANDRLRMFAYDPIWPGFAINTFFYAAILWLLFAFPFALRRWRRVRRGLCAKCAYPVGASEVCTECGAALRR